MINEGKTSVKASIDQLFKTQRPDVGQRTPDVNVDVSAFETQWKVHKGSQWPWPFWSAVVLPYLSETEREELLGALLSTPDPNLSYAVAIVTRMCRGEGTPKKRRGATKQNPGAVPTVVAGRSQDEDDFLAAISR